MSSAFRALPRTLLRPSAVRAAARAPRVGLAPACPCQQQQHQLARPFFGWFNAAFNRVDPDRIAEVGPDRAAAEWLLRCGASVTWVGSRRPLKDYNSLPRGDYRRNRIEEVDATDSCVMENGFPHFEGLSSLRKIKFKNCQYLTDTSLKYLVMTKLPTLEDLEVSDNGTVTDDGVVYLRKMETLRRLRLQNLPGVDDPQMVIGRISAKLPNCVVEFPPHTGPEEEEGKEPEGGGG